MRVSCLMCCFCVLVCLDCVYCLCRSLGHVSQLSICDGMPAERSGCFLSRCVSTRACVCVGGCLRLCLACVSGIRVWELRTRWGLCGAVSGCYWQSRAVSEPVCVLCVCVCVGSEGLVSVIGWLMCVMWAACVECLCRSRETSVFCGCLRCARCHGCVGLELAGVCACVHVCPRLTVGDGVLRLVVEG